MAESVHSPDPFAPIQLPPDLASVHLRGPTAWSLGTAGPGISVYSEDTATYNRAAGSEFAMVLSGRGWPPVSEFVYYFEITVQTARVYVAAADTRWRKPWN
jgi:hypothetical protein